MSAQRRTIPRITVTHGHVPALSFGDRLHGMRPAARLQGTHVVAAVVDRRERVLADVYGRPAHANPAASGNERSGIPDQSLAALFAASADLYYAASAAYHMLARTHGDLHPTVRKLALALRKAHGS